MRDDTFYVSNLLELDKVRGEERKARFRQAIATLARTTAEGGPGPLEGLHPGALLRGVQTAIQAGFIDDLDWLTPAAAGLALFSLASALPSGAEQRDLGRRVLGRLLAGNAETFVTMASRMALTAGRGLSAPGVRARVALVAELPLSAGIADGPLALALVSRREYAREWISAPSTKSLPARRLAARLLERAAREAARRAALGDLHPLRVLSSDALKPAWDRLLYDRESLVWRHVAIARGLLLPWQEKDNALVEAAFGPDHTITEWRRAATSAVANLAVRPEDALRLLRSALRRQVLQRDPGASSAFVWGLARAAESEPDAAREFYREMFPLCQGDVGEALVELKRELGETKLVKEAAAAYAERFPVASTGMYRTDDGQLALSAEVLMDLDGSAEGDLPLREQSHRALMLFHTEGPAAAHLAARESLSTAQGVLGTIEAINKDEEDADTAAAAIERRTQLGALRDLDISLLERNVLFDLLKLGQSLEQVRSYEEQLDVVRQRFAEWLLGREGELPTPQDSSEDRPSRPTRARPALTVVHPTLRMRRLRTLLHLVDGDLGEGSDDAARTQRLRGRWQRIAKGLVLRFECSPPAPLLRRSFLATLARAFEAVVRTGACDSADVLLVLAGSVTSADDFAVLAEASMDPDLSHILGTFGRFIRATQPKIVLAPEGSLAPPAAAPKSGDRVLALEKLASEFLPEMSLRSEALRTSLLRLASALAVVDRAPSLRNLSTTGGVEPDSIAAVENAVFALHQLAAGAQSRLDPDRAQASVTPSRAMTLAVSRVLAGTDAKFDDEEFGRAQEDLLVGLPSSITKLAGGVFWRLTSLPVNPSADAAPESSTFVSALPAWMPPRRILGGFYVQRALGVGGAGTVFVVTRAEERNEPGAEQFALKVPDYTATAAASLSEAEFLAMFRTEASALMLLPSHQNLARFATFDTAAKPKPILVMELVEGRTLEHAVETRAMDVPTAFRAFDGIAAGLGVMHDAGLGHLDVKPGNVVLRKGRGDAVLVDFGLAGRHLRPGCGTGPYGAPEVWGVAPDDYKATPPPADVYALACVIFEGLTTKVLFEGPNATAQVAAHLVHDGWPPHVKALKEEPETAPLAELLASMLRRDPRERPSIQAVRDSLRSVASGLASAPWPLRVPGAPV